MNRGRYFARVVAVLGLLLLGGCAQEVAPEQDALSVVATTTMLQDLTSVIGGDLVVCTGLMGPGVDPHLYQASARDVTKLEQADVVVYNGLHLEGQMGEVFENLSSDQQTVISIEEGISPEKFLQTEGVYDPHIWFDVSLWADAACYIANTLSVVDANNQQVYQENLQAYLSELEQLETYVQAQIDTIPLEQRVLITAHDAFGYFGAAYGLEVMGLQGISTQTEVSAADLRTLATLIASREIKAVFVESSVSTKTMEALQSAVEAQGFSVTMGGSLYSDSLGDASTGHQTYLATVRANVDTIVGALS